MKLLSCAITTTGKIRKNNQDNYYVNGHICKKENTSYEMHEDVSENSGVYAVCDGMGGYSDGEIISFICVRILKEYQCSIGESVNEYIEDINRKVCEYIENNGGVKSGATLALLHINDGVARAYNIGDSRIYVLKENRLLQMSTDHTQAQRMVNIGLLTSEQANSDPGKYVLTQHIGIPAQELMITPSVSEDIPLASGDRLLVCSDGLTDMLSDDEILSAMGGSHTYLSTCKELVEAAIAKGGKDNITVIVIEIL